MASPSVLVVDDEPQISLLVRETLTGAGMEIRSAGDGRQALRLLQEFEPDPSCPTYLTTAGGGGYAFEPSADAHTV